MVGQCAARAALLALTLSALPAGNSFSSSVGGEEGAFRDGRSAPAAPPAPPDAVATAPAGAFHGFVENGTRTWRGIPYAESPVGDLRWKVTVPKAPLTSPLATKAFGATCAQLGPGWPSMGGMIKNCHNYMNGCPNVTWSNATSEDCLFLNVYSPAASPAQAGDALLPVRRPRNLL